MSKKNTAAWRARWEAAGRPELQHGKFRAIRNGCRCQPCRARMLKAMLAYYASRPEEFVATVMAYEEEHPGVALERLSDAFGHSSGWWGPPDLADSRSANHVRRAQMMGSPHENFTLADVVGRDGWQCGICWKRVNPRGKGRLAPSLDHILPIALGGPHTLANAQLAHLGCNARKGARMIVAARD